MYLGFTVPEVDKILAPYGKKSFEYYKNDYLEIAKDFECTDYIEEQATEYAMKKVQRDFEQGWQGIEYKLNTVGSSRGDYPSNFQAA